MVKYGKQYRRLQLEEWKKYYVDYKALKHKIRQMKRILVNEIKIKEKQSRPSLLSIPLLPEEIKNKEDSVYNNKNGEHLKEFIDLLIKEFRKSFTFFKNIEKVLNKKVNAHLNTRTYYSTYSLSELTKEMKSFSLTVYLSKCLNGFINDIMMAMKKILKKFDKHFSHLYGLITPHLVLKLLSKKKSELEYMLQFKIIDEISVIAENCILELKRYFEQNNEKDGADNIKYRNEFLAKFNETLKYIRDIDELIYFKTQYKDWVDYITNNKTKTSGKYLENDIFNPILSASYYKDNLLDKFISTNDAFGEVKQMQKSLTLVNKRNIILVLTHTFFSNNLLTCILPFLFFYVYKSNPSFNFYLMNCFSFIVISVTYLAQFLSIFFFYNYMSIKKIKVFYTLSYIFIFIGSFMHLLSIKGLGEEKNYTLLFLLGISRFLIGLGSNPMLGKKYITLYTPKYLLPKLSKIYLMIELLGFTLGPSITAALYYNLHDIFFNSLNCIGYYGIIGSIILFIINFIIFVSPGHEKFSVVENQSKEDINMSSSVINTSNFGDIDDTQDQEFYRLQKDKNNKKKGGLDQTKSDEIHIEINDNEANKSNAAISNTNSNANFYNEKEEKEDDDANYNKIMEKAGENEIEQNLIVKNSYYNVDMGRFSEVDISKEDRDTINQIEIRLFEYQEKSNFTYINMMPRTLDDIILKEHKTFGYMNRNFVIMLFLLLFNNFIKENLIIYSSYYILYIVYKGKGEIHNYTNTDLKRIGLLISAELILQLISIFFIMPFYKINIIFKKNLMIFMITSILLMIPISLSIPILEKKYVYIPITCFDITIHKIIEYYCSCYLVYLIPPQWKYAHIRASSLPIYLMTLGKFFSCFLCFTYHHNYLDKNNDDNNLTIPFHNYILTIIALCAYGIIGIIIYKSKNFRVKALARILRRKATE